MEENKKNKFKTPEGYFDSFHDRLMDKIHEEDNIKSTSLIPKSDGFTIPDGYFEGLPQSVFKKLKTKDTKVIQFNGSRKIYYRITAVAAVLILFFGLIWNNESKLTIDDLASTEITDYFESTDYALSTYEIVEVLDLQELELNDVLETNLEDENILEYLDENVDDLEDLNLDYENYD